MDGHRRLWLLGLTVVQVIHYGSVVALEQGLHEEAERPHHTHTHKDPQEEAVDHHGHVLPVFNNLQENYNLVIQFNECHPTVTPTD